MFDDIDFKRHGGLFIPAHIKPKRQRPIAFSLFSGCGGFDLAIIQAGFEVVGANEFDAEAALTYLTNLASYPVQIHYIDGEADKEKLDSAVRRSWGLKKGQELTPEYINKYIKKNKYGHKGELESALNVPIAGSGWIKHHADVPPVRNFWFGDVCKLTGKEICYKLGINPGDLDLVFGGPPCQGFSHAGKREVGDERNTLIFEMARLILELQPKTFVLENVPGIVSMLDGDGMPVFDKFIKIISDGGFGKFDVLKKSLLMQAGTGAVINRKLIPKEKTKPKKEILPKPAPVANDDMPLFGDISL